MPKKKEVSLNLEISFLKSPKKAGDRRALLKKIRSLIEKERESLPFEDIKFEKNSIVMFAEKVFSAIYSIKPMSMTITLEDPEVNIKEGNDIGNKLVNYVNTVLGDFGKGARAFSFEMFYQEDKTDFVRKVVDEGKIAKFNELAQKTLNPVGLMFEYSVNDRETLLVSFQFKPSRGLGVFSRYTYKDALPWDLLLSEHKALVGGSKIFEKLREV